MTKEEIIEKHKSVERRGSGNGYDFQYLNKPSASAAMDEWAQQEAKEFAEWLLKNHFHNSGFNGWMSDTYNSNYYGSTTEDVYRYWQQSLKQQP